MDDLLGVFEIRRQHRLHLNADKCLFGVGVNKFLGDMITHWGIEVNLDQISAIEWPRPPSNPKEV